MSLNNRTIKRCLSGSYERGLTLVEIMVVLIILGVVGAVIIGKLTGAGDKAKAQLNLTKMQDLKNAIGMYQLRYNSLPPNLDALIHGTSENSNMFLSVANPEQLKDVWGQPFQYALKENGRSYVIKSTGSDMQEGGSDAAQDVTLEGP